MRDIFMRGNSFLKENSSPPTKEILPSLIIHHPSFTITAREARGNGRARRHPSLLPPPCRSTALCGCATGIGVRTIACARPPTSANPSWHGRSAARRNANISGDSAEAVGRRTLASNQNRRRGSRHRGQAAAVTATVARRIDAVEILAIC